MSKSIEAQSTPTLIERAEELARGGDYDFVYQVERRLIEEGFAVGRPPRIKAPDRKRLLAALKAARS
jgi:hypothetical protein